MHHHVFYDPKTDGHDEASFDAGWERGVADVVRWLHEHNRHVAADAVQFNLLDD